MGRKPTSLGGGKLHDAIPAFGRPHDSPQGGNILEKARHDAIGGHHEVLDQFRGPVLLLLHYVDDFLVQHERMKFVGLQAEGSVLVALIFQLLCDFILQPELRLQVG